MRSSESTLSSALYDHIDKIDEALNHEYAADHSAADSGANGESTQPRALVGIAVIDQARLDRGIQIEHSLLKMTLL